MSQRKNVISLSTIQRMLKGHIPGQLVIQLHSKCNARCPQCGMRATSDIERSKLEADDIKKILDAAAERGVKAVSFTGGEPLLYADEVVALIEHAESLGIDYIRTGTNGFMFRNSTSSDFEKRVTKLAESLARTKLYTFWISIDSAVPEMHEEMRGLPGVIAGIEKALPIFHAHGIYPAVNLGINRNIGGRYNLHTDEGESDHHVSEKFYETFRSGFKRFFDFVLGLGFTMSNTCYPMSIEPDDTGNLHAVYTATSVDNIVNFTPQEKALLFRALFDTVPEYRSKLRIFTPRSSLYALVKHYSGEEFPSYPCRGGVDFFFVDSADAYTYPCGFRGSESMGHYWDPKFTPVDEQPSCKACDWECFRDPSEMFGPFIDIFHQPLAVLKRFRNDKEYTRVWWDDWRYSYNCQFFDGRVPPNYRKLARFAPPAEEETIAASVRGREQAAQGDG